MPRDIEKVRAARRRWYTRNAEHAKTQIKGRRRDIATWWAEFKTTQRCTDCEENHPACLDFHHISTDKTATLAEAVHAGWSRERIMEEVAKCVCLCANCHRKRHWNDRAIAQR